VDLFRDLSERDMAELDRITTSTSVPRGRVFYQPEDVSEVLFLLREGACNSTASPPRAKSW